MYALSLKASGFAVAVTQSGNQTEARYEDEEEADAEARHQYYNKYHLKDFYLSQLRLQQYPHL